MTVASLIDIRLAPLNQIAILKLKAMQVAIREDELPIFQLMQWGVAHGVRLTHQRTAAELLRLRLRPDQKQAYEYLFDQVPGGLLAFEKLLLKLPPRSAAEELLDLLDMRLKADPCNPYPDSDGR